MKNVLCYALIAGLAAGGVLSSHTIRAAGAEEVLRPFNGKNLEGWKTRRRGKGVPAACVGAVPDPSLGG